MLLFWVCFLTSITLCSQADSLGEWRTLQAYRTGTDVTESPNSIIYTTGKAIFFLDKEDLSITRLAREDGLAEARIRLIRYHGPTATLIIVYESSVIDLYRNGRFSTLRQIDNFNFSGDKQVNALFFGPNNRVYLAAGYGVSVLDLENETFLFTTFTGAIVAGVALHNGFIYTATDEGIYRAPEVGVNLSDFGTWSLLGGANGFPGDYASPVIEVFNEQLYFGIGQDVYRLQADTAALFYDADEAPLWELEYLSTGPNLLMVGYRCTDNSCRDRQIRMYDANGLRQVLRNECFFDVTNSLEDDRGRIWLSESGRIPGIRYLSSATSRECITLEYGGPPTDDNFRLLHDGSALWVAPGVLDDNFSPSFTAGGVYRLRDGEWTGFNRRNTDVFRGRDGQEQGDDDVGTIVDVHYDPVGQRHWFSSFFEGAIAWDDANESGEIFDELNSSLQFSAGAGPGRVRVAGAVSDPQGFTYLANNRAAQDAIVSVRSPEGEWAALGTMCNDNLALDIAIDPNGLVWVVHATSVGGSLTVLDPMGTPMDPSDDTCRTITSSNSALPTNSVRSVAVDLEGNVWVGTAQGIVVFSCGPNVFDPEICAGDLPIAEADEFGGFLLETEEIRSITVDGANRKWIGTGGGAYLLSPSGEEQLLFFDKDNSPLPDNLVRDIAIDPRTGIVYFGTELGIASYRGDATAATQAFRQELVIFPNPVEPGYQGPIAINGLARDALVKVTDLSGKLVAEGNAAGGQFLWSGTDYNGRRVTSGVYLVFASSKPQFSITDPGSAVGKIVFIR